jgi:hypothetical protein
MWLFSTDVSPLGLLAVASTRRGFSPFTPEKFVVPYAIEWFWSLKWCVREFSLAVLSKPRFTFSWLFIFVISHGFTSQPRTITDKPYASDVEFCYIQPFILSLVMNVSTITDSLRSSANQWSVRIMIPHRYKELRAAVTKPSALLCCYVSTCSVYATFLAQNLKVFTPPPCFWAELLNVFLFLAVFRKYTILR